MGLQELFKFKASEDIIDILKAEHKEVDGIFKAIEELSDRARGTREELYAELKEKLASHAHAEQDVLYTAMKKVKDLKRDAFEGFQEHSLVDVLFEKLDRISVSQTDLWPATIKVLKEIVQHHVKEEEGEIFPKVKKHFSSEERKELGRKFLKAQNLILGQSKGRSKKTSTHQSERAQTH